jgi:hypothetical protein
MFNDTVNARRRQTAVALARRKQNPYFDSNSPGVVVDNNGPVEPSFSTVPGDMRYTAPTVAPTTKRTIIGEDTVVQPQAQPSVQPVAPTPSPQTDLQKLTATRARIRRSVGI